MGVTIGHALHQAGLQSGREEVLGRELAGSVRASWVDESYKDVAEHKKGRRMPSASASLGVFSSRVTDYSKTELSEAESATASISFIGGILALGRKLVSEKDELEELIEPVPLVMDAPFSAFDKTKIEAICNVIPGITLQVIIFIKDTDGDIALHYFAERIGKKFKITRNEEFISSITEDL